MNDELAALESLGLVLPTPAYFFGMILFSIIGYAAYRFGKKKQRNYTKWIGIALMLYPYIVPSTLGMYLVGAALCGAWYYYRDR